MRVLITGAAGFAGCHLAAEAARNGSKVLRMVRPSARRRPRQGKNTAIVDLLDAAGIEKAVHRFKPEAVFHLAGQPSVGLSWHKPEETFRIHVDGTRNLFEALKKLSKKPKVVVSLSAEEYGATGDEKKFLKESDLLKPLNPYAWSKVMQDFLSHAYFRKEGIPVVRARAFNHIGPGQSDAFVVSSFAKQRAEIDLGLRKPLIETGNLEVVRDFTDVRDTVRAYWVLLRRGVPGSVYNIASGIPRRLSEILQFYLQSSSVRISTRVSAKRLRKTELKRLVGDACAVRALGWSPEVTFEKSLADALAWWKTNLKKGQL